MAQGSIITEAQNERICEALWGFYDPITVYEWSDRKQKRNPMKAYKVPEGKRYIAGGGFYSTHVDEQGIRLGFNDPRYRLPDLTRNMESAWNAYQELRRRGWRIQITEVVGTGPEGNDNAGYECRMWFRCDSGNNWNVISNAQAADDAILLAILDVIALEEKHGRGLPGC